MDRLAFGVLLRGRGAVRTTGYSLIDVSAHPQAPATSSQASTGSVVVTPAPTAPPPPATTPTAPVVPSEGLPAPIEKLPSQCEELAREEPPLELSLPEGPSTEPLSVTGRWTVREGVDHARTVHAVLLQNGKLLLMAGSGNSRMEFDAGCFRSYVYNPVANTWKEIPTPTDLFCAGHVQLANGNVLILGGTKGYPEPPKPGEYPSTVYKGENASWIFNIKTEAYEKVPYNELEPHQPKEPGPLLNGAWYPSATELGNGNVISFGGSERAGRRRHLHQLLHRSVQHRRRGRRPARAVGRLRQQRTAADLRLVLGPVPLDDPHRRRAPLLRRQPRVRQRACRASAPRPLRTRRLCTTSTARPANRSRKKKKNRTTPIPQAKVVGTQGGGRPGL